MEPLLLHLTTKLNNKKKKKREKKIRADFTALSLEYETVSPHGGG